MMFYRFRLKKRLRGLKLAMRNNEFRNKAKKENDQTQPPRQESRPYKRLLAAFHFTSVCASIFHFGEVYHMQYITKKQFRRCVQV